MLAFIRSTVYLKKKKTKHFHHGSELVLEEVANRICIFQYSKLNWISFRAGIWGELVGLQKSLLNQVSYAKSQKMFVYSENKCLLLWIL